MHDMLLVKQHTRYLSFCAAVASACIMTPLLYFFVARMYPLSVL